LIALGCALLSGVIGCSAKVVPTGSQISNPPATRADNIERLGKLHATRSAEADDREYIVGPGDVLGIRAFDFNELNRPVRVDGDGNIALPLLETVHVGGRTVSAVEKELTRQLGKYMYEPYVTVFVDEYRSQQVVVVGAVQKPGLITLVDRDSTVLDAIAASGGMTDGAAGRIYLLPGEERNTIDIDQLALALNDKATQAMVEKTDSDAQPLMLNTKEAPQGVERFFWSLPVRGGDVIVVATTGNFILQGWVHKPGTYKLQPGLTLRGAVATGGGLRFAADRSDVRVHRLTADGDIDTETFSYEAIVRDQMPDVFIHEGDVVEVASSKMKLVPYGVYQLTVDLVRFGAGIKVVP
jgi:polysaccharide export outer membrane protein